MIESKTELILFGSRHQMKKFKINQINVNEIVKRRNTFNILVPS